MDDQRHPASAQGERLEHPGQPEVVIGVVVREEHLGQLHKPDGGAEQLALGALSAVEEQALAAPPQEGSRKARLAVGTEPDVPRKTRSRSMAPV